MQKTMTDAQHHETIKRTHKRYHDAIDAALAVGLDVRGVSVTKPQIALARSPAESEATSIVSRPALTVVRTFK